MKINIFNNLLLILFAFYPISILIGNLSININIFLISSIFIIGLFLRIFNLKNQKKTFLLIFFFFLTLLVNLVFSNNIILSYPRVLKIFFVIFFVCSFGFMLNTAKEEKIKIIYKIWTLVFLLITLDLLKEFFSGTNIIGLTSVYPGSRLGSFTGKESVIGNYYLGFCLIALSYAKNYSKIKNLSLLLGILFIMMSFLIGERANFIRTIIVIILYQFFLHETKIRYKILSIILLIISFLTILNFNPEYKKRYYNQIGLVFQKGVTKYLKETNYGAHRNVAKEIFKDNPIFGVGIKNFRVESANPKYDNLDHKQNYLRVSTHPHELYHELISETGLFGLLSFLIFIILSLFLSLKNYMIYKNPFQFSAILFVLISILPVLPSGSFLSTFSSSIFWINYSLMMGYNLKKN